MIAVDTNVLVYAHRRDSEFHRTAAAKVRGLAEGRTPWALPWPCLHEFFSIVTHPRIYDPPSRVDQALEQIDAWLETASAVVLAEGETYWPRLRDLLADGKISGPARARCQDRRALPDPRRTGAMDGGPGLHALSPPAHREPADLTRSGQRFTR